MSVKARNLANIITAPLPTCRFKISIPEIEFLTIVESSKLPTQGAVRKMDLWMGGEKVSFPSIPENGGEWSVTLPESTSGMVRKRFNALSSEWYNQKTGECTDKSQWKDIIVAQCDLQDKIVAQVVLHDAFLVRKPEVDLNGSNADQATKLTYSFYYNWIEE